MSELHIHIVSFNVPYPANYGGVIDVWYKIKSLHDVGVHIHLHCFQYGRQPIPNIQDCCDEVFYYERKTGFKSILSLKPYIVVSRNDKSLLNNLLRDKYPILFEGLHTTYFLDNKYLKERLKIVRAHNIEHKYYWNLFKRERNFLKKLFFLTESFKLKLYQSQLNNAQRIAAISQHELRYFMQKYGNTILLPPFHAYCHVESLKGFGNYILYHADLSVSDNVKSALFVIRALSQLNYQIIIAGQSPDKRICKMVAKASNVKLIENPSENKMAELISNAQIIALPTFQDAGIKLKLIESLYRGRHCVVTSMMLKGSNLNSLCYVSDTEEDFCQVCVELINVPFTDKDIQERNLILGDLYNNAKNAEILKSYFD